MKILSLMILPLFLGFWRRTLGGGNTAVFAPMRNVLPFLFDTGDEIKLRRGRFIVPFGVLIITLLLLPFLSYWSLLFGLLMVAQFATFGGDFSKPLHLFLWHTLCGLIVWLDFYALYSLGFIDNIVYPVLLLSGLLITLTYSILKKLYGDGNWSELAESISGFSNGLLLILTLVQI